MSGINSWLRHTRLATLLVVALVVAACGGNNTGTEGATASPDASEAAATGDESTETSPGETENTDPSELTEITVGNSPTISNVSIAVAIEEGLMAEQGLEATLTPVTSGAQAVPLLLNGEIQFTAADPAGVLTARAGGVPLVIVASANVGASSAENDTTSVLVAGDSDINGPADFAGTTLGTHAIGSMAQISTAAAIDQGGGDSSQVEFVEVPIPQMLDSVSRGQVDGVIINEPFTTQGTQQGLKIALAPFSASMRGIPALVYATTEEYAAQNPAVVDAFAAAIQAGNARVSGNEELIREVGARSTETPPEVLEAMILPEFPREFVDNAVYERLMGLMVEYGVLEEPVDLSAAVFQRGVTASSG